jgi:hypothetical protein
MQNNQVMDRLKLHFQPSLNDLREILIPEWGEESTFYYSSMNLKERQRIERNAKDDAEIAVEIIIAKLCDKDGNKLFNRSHKMDFMTKVDPSVIGRVAHEILDVSTVEFEEAEKN